MVHDHTDVIEGPATLDQIAVRFDEQRLVSDAGLPLTGSLAERLGVERLVNDSVWLDPKAAGNTDLRPGLTATAAAIIDQRADALLVPNRAIRTEGRQKVVAVERERLCRAHRGDREQPDQRLMPERA